MVLVHPLDERLREMPSIACGRDWRLRASALVPNGLAMDASNGGVSAGRDPHQGLFVRNCDQLAMAILARRVMHQLDTVRSQDPGGICHVDVSVFFSLVPKLL